MARTQKRWTYSAGEKGRNRVLVFEPRTGPIRMEWYEGTRRCSKSLKHRDRAKAKAQADAAAAGFSEPTTIPEPAPPPERPLTLSQLFDKFGARAKARGTGRRKHEARAAEMMQRLWGKDRAVISLDCDDLDSYVEARRSGRIRAPTVKAPRPVGDRMIEYELRYLRSAVTSAMRKRDDRGQQLLDRNPMDGFRIPVEMNPKRPLLYDEEYEALRAVAGSVNWRFASMLVLAHETGHRIGAIRSLVWADIDLEGGTINWRKINDKIGMTHQTPMTPAAQQALVAARDNNPGIGEAAVFPNPWNPSQPVSRELALQWWRAAEKLAGLEHVRGRGWHSLRRKFATELKDVPLKDLCALGGWKDHNTILKCYQQADEATMKQALLNREPVRKSAVRR